jgi:hypothetical protein
MNISKKAFERMFRGKTQVPYKLKIEGQDYTINLRLRWKYKFFKAFMRSMGQKVGRRASLPNTFKANPDTYGFLIKNIEPTLNKIVDSEKKKINNFKLLTANITDAEFEREGEDIQFKIKVEGLCRYDL